MERTLDLKGEGGDTALPLAAASEGEGGGLSTCTFRNDGASPSSSWCSASSDTTSAADLLRPFLSRSVDDSSVEEEECCPRPEDIVLGADAIEDDRCWGEGTARNWGLTEPPLVLLVVDMLPPYGDRKEELYTFKCGGGFIR